MSLEGKPRHVVGVKEMQNYKKESLPRMSKNDVPSSFRYHSCAGREVFDYFTGIISKVWVCWKFACAGLLSDKLLDIVYNTDSASLLFNPVSMGEVIHFKNCPFQG